ncbi:MAG TPA: hypothetical protein VEX38_03055, partial [Fimbriimonadaceae bacterium]|nr:hypothetical protein [Fimbriimonadaceae bacterium]
STIQAGATATGTVTLTSNAPAGGALVQLASSSSVIQVPASVTVAAGARSANFNVTTSPVGSTYVRTVTASRNGITRSFNVTLVPGQNLTGLSITPSTIKGGNSATGTVTISAIAPAGGVQVQLTSSTSAIQVPSTVSVPAGATSVNFTVTTSRVGATYVRQVTASRNGITRTVNVTLTP